MKLAQGSAVHNGQSRKLDKVVHLSAQRADWLHGSAVNPCAVPTTPLPALDGFPFIPAIGCSVQVSGETGGGRSTLAEAGLYDAARAGLECLYIANEVSYEEFCARAATMAQARGDALDDGLLGDLARIRYADVGTVLTNAWAHPDVWADAGFDVVVIDPLSSAEATLELDFESNRDYVRFYERLVQPLVDRGVVVILLDNIGHAEEAKHRAKGASAKADKADLTFTCIRKTSPEALVIKAKKVRSVRADVKRDDEWTIAKATQQFDRTDPHTAAPIETFRPTYFMEQISRTLEDNDGMSLRMIKEAVKGRDGYKRKAIDLLVIEGYAVNVGKGQAHEYRSVQPYRQNAENEPLPTVAQPLPDCCPATVQQPLPVRTPPLRGGSAGQRSARASESGLTTATVARSPESRETSIVGTTVMVPDPLHPDRYEWAMNRTADETGLHRAGRS
jgi:hypothetical protein